MASGFWFNVGGESTAAIHISEDGSATVATANPDIGGSRASMAIMAAETLGIPVENVRPVVPDTASIGYSMLTGGSRTTFAVGMAVVQAAEKVVAELKGRAAKLWEISPEKVAWEDGRAICLDAAKDAKPMTLKAIAGQSVLPITFLRQIIRFYGDSVQALLPSYLEYSIDRFTGEQQKMREAANGAFGHGPFAATSFGASVGIVTSRLPAVRPTTASCMVRSGREIVRSRPTVPTKAAKRATTRTTNNERRALSEASFINSRACAD